MHIFNADQHTIEAVIDETRADFSQLDTSFKRNIAVFADRAHIEFPREGTRYELSLHDACPFKKAAARYIISLKYSSETSNVAMQH